MIAPADAKDILWPLFNSTLGLAVAGWLWRQNGRIDAMFQHLFGVPGAANGGTAARLRILEQQSSDSRSDPSQSAAGRELLTSLEELRKALARASDATDLVKKDINDRLLSIEGRIGRLETGPPRRRQP